AAPACEPASGACRIGDALPDGVDGRAELALDDQVGSGCGALEVTGGFGAHGVLLYWNICWNIEGSARRFGAAGTFAIGDAAALAGIAAAHAVHFGREGVEATLPLARGTAELAEVPLAGGEGGEVELVLPYGSADAVAHEARLTQHAQVTAHCRSTDRKCLGDGSGRRDLVA